MVVKFISNCYIKHKIFFLFFYIGAYHPDDHNWDYYIAAETWPHDGVKPCVCCQATCPIHYSDVIMGDMASQITSLSIVYLIVYSRRRSKKTSKLRVTGLCEGNSLAWSLEAARWDIIMIVSLWNLTGISAALLPKCLSNFRAIGNF